MTWEEYYEKVWKCKPSTLVNYMSKLSSFGPSEEVMEAVLEIAFEDEMGATRLLKKATDTGVKFSGGQLAEMYGSCSDSEWERAIRFSANQFTDTDLDDLYGILDDELIEEIARKYKVALPQDLVDYCEDEVYEEDFYKMSSAEVQEAYDYVLHCLNYALEKLKCAYSLSVADLSSQKRTVSIAKHACLMEAEPFIDEARSTLEEIGAQGIEKGSIQSIQSNMGRRIIFSDAYGDGFLVDWMIQRHIKKMMVAVQDICKEVQKLRDRV